MVRVVVLEVRRGGVGLMQINAQVGLKGEFSHLGIREIVMRMKLAGALCGAVLGITVPAMAEDAAASRTLISPISTKSSLKTGRSMLSWLRGSPVSGTIGTHIPLLASTP